jgi:putative oxidoreductase
MNTMARKVPTGARIVLGLIFTVFGLNGFLHFLPQPPMSGPPAEYFTALVAMGYMLPIVMATELVAGLLLLSGRFVSLALTLLAPVIVNILCYHLVVAKGGFILPLVVLAAEVYLAWAYRDAFAPMLRARQEPRVASAAKTRVPATVQ